MPVGASKLADAEKTRIMLGLLESVERGGTSRNVGWHRSLASLSGWSMPTQALYQQGAGQSARRAGASVCLLFDSKGFCRKSRLTIEYLTHSFSLFRQAKAEYTDILVAARARGVSRLAILGASDLAEIAAICALDLGIALTAVVDPQCKTVRFVGIPVARSFEAVDDSVDAALVADIVTAPQTIRAAIAHYGAERVLVPGLLSSGAAERSEVWHD